MLCAETDTRWRTSCVQEERFAARDVRWDPMAATMDLAAMEGADAIIHLCGASIGDGRWTNERKRPFAAAD